MTNRGPLSEEDDKALADSLPLEEFAVVETVPEGDFTASMWARLGAAFIDQLILAAIFLSLEITQLLHLQDRKTIALDLLIVVTVIFFYQFLFLSLKSATPGKLLLGIMVVAAETRGRRPASDARIVKRSVFGPLMMLIYPLPFVFSFLRSDRRQLADLLSGTKVIATDRAVRKKRPLIAILLALLGLAFVGLLIKSFFILAQSQAESRDATSEIEKVTGLDFKTKCLPATLQTTHITKN